MGLISGITSAVNYIPRAFDIGKRAVKTVPYFIFNEVGADTFVRSSQKAVKTANESWGTALKRWFKTTGKDVESAIAKNKASKGSLLEQAWKSIKTLPKDISSKMAAGKRLAIKQGKNGIVGSTKGLFKAIGKRMPLIGSALIVLGELPNVVTAVKEQGLLQGAAEIFKAGSRLVGGSIAGAMAGSAFGPVGSIVGFIAGDWLVSKIVGKSYTEQKEEAQEKANEAAQNLVQQQQQIQTAPQFTPSVNPYNQYNPYMYGNIGNYSNDFMKQSVDFSKYYV